MFQKFSVNIFKYVIFIVLRHNEILIEWHKILKNSIKYIQIFFNVLIFEKKKLKLMLFYRV